MLNTILLPGGRGNGCMSIRRRRLQDEPILKTLKPQLNRLALKSSTGPVTQAEMRSTHRNVRAAGKGAMIVLPGIPVTSEIVDSSHWQLDIEYLRCMPIAFSPQLAGLMCYGTNMLDSYRRAASTSTAF